MRTFAIRYEDPEGQIDEIEVDVENHEDEADAEEAAREKLSAEYPPVDTDEWEILGITEVILEVDEVRVYKYDSDIPANCWAADIGRDTLYLIAQRGADGQIEVSVNHGYLPGSPQYCHDASLFAENEDAIRRGAEAAITEFEAGLDNSAPALALS